MTLTRANVGTFQRIGFRRIATQKTFSDVV